MITEIKDISDVQNAVTALESEISMVDLGGHTKNVIEQLSYHDRAVEKGITIVPDCGMGPGMNISMALLAMEELDKPQDVFIWDGGLPKSPKPPWNYSLFFNIKGLTNEYDGSAYFIRDGNKSNWSGLLLSKGLFENAKHFVLSLSVLKA